MIRLSINGINNIDGIQVKSCIILKQNNHRTKYHEGRLLMDKYCIGRFFSYPLGMFGVFIARSSCFAFKCEFI